MIPKIFHLFWAGGPISYLRYLTFVTLRHHHPEWTIKFYRGNKFKTQQWGIEQQDFQQTGILDHTDKIVGIADEALEYNEHPNMAPNFQSDFFRWDVLANDGGFYLDMDQLILKPFDDLCHHKFIYSVYEEYAAVGVIGSEPNFPVVGQIRRMIKNRYSPDNYNVIGPYLFLSVHGSKKELFQDTFNSTDLFYPIRPHPPQIKQIYDGTLQVPLGRHYAFHWYGGHPYSQEFNKSYTRETMQNGVDTISKIVRPMLKGVSH